MTASIRLPCSDAVQRTEWQVQMQTFTSIRANILSYLALWASQGNPLQQLNILNVVFEVLA
jgi:hypothetical protein